MLALTLGLVLLAVVAGTGVGLYPGRAHKAITETAGMATCLLQGLLARNRVMTAIVESPEALDFSCKASSPVSICCGAQSARKRYGL